MGKLSDSADAAFALSVAAAVAYAMGRVEKIGYHDALGIPSGNLVLPGDVYVMKGFEIASIPVVLFAGLWGIAAVRSAPGEPTRFQPAFAGALAAGSWAAGVCLVAVWRSFDLLTFLFLAVALALLVVGVLFLRSRILDRFEGVGPAQLPVLSVTLLLLLVGSGAYGNAEGVGELEGCGRMTTLRATGDFDPAWQGRPVLLLSHVSGTYFVRDPGQASGNQTVFAIPESQVHSMLIEQSDERFCFP